MSSGTEVKEIYGLIASFDAPEPLLRATEKARKAGYKQMDAYAPLPIHGLEEALGQPYTKLPWLVFAAGLTGALVAFGLQTWVSVEAYPLNVGGRPLFSWPAFIPVTFELTVLFAALAAVAGMIMFNGLPMPHHPVFNAPGFERASTDRFFLCIEAEDGKFDLNATRKFLEETGPLEVSVVER